MNYTYFFFIDTECGLDYAKFITCPNIKDIKNFLRKHRLKFPANIINKFKSKDMPYREFIEGGGDDFVEIYFEKFGK